MAYNKNKLYKTLDYWSRDMLNFGFSENSLGLVSRPHSVYDFSRKMFLMLYILLTDQISLVALTSWDIGQNLYYNCLLTRLWRHKFDINLIFLIKPFCCLTSEDKNVTILKTKKAFEVNKYFLSFLKGFQLQKIGSYMRVRL